MSHIIPKKTYYLVFTALMLLLVVTIAVAYVEAGRLNIVLAMTIAIIKALLVILYFMHVRYSSHLVWIFAVAGFFWLGILLAFAMSDYMTRGWLPPPIGWE